MTNGESSPKHFITEPLLSFVPEKLDNGDLRMAIACAGQHAYNMQGEEATLTEDFLSKDYATWDDGLVSINHENNNQWVKAKIYDPKYDSKIKIVTCSFSGFPDWVKSLIFSEEYRGLSQECIPVKYGTNSTDVIRGFGTGVTIVTDPYCPAATQDMGVGVRPELAAILASKYHDHQNKPHIEDSMSDKQGGGTPAISVETYESAVSERAELKSQLMALESQKKTLETELASTKTELEEYKSGETNRTKIAVESAIKSYDAELRSRAENEEATKELRSVMSEEAVTNYLATNPSIVQIKSITGILKVNFSKGVGSSINSIDQEDGKSYDELNSAWNAKLGRA